MTITTIKHNYIPLTATKYLNSIPIFFYPQSYTSSRILLLRSPSASGSAEAGWNFYINFESKEHTSVYIYPPCRDTYIHRRLLIWVLMINPWSKSDTGLFFCANSNYKYDRVLLNFAADKGGWNCSCWILGTVDCDIPTLNVCKGRFRRRFPWQAVHRNANGGSSLGSASGTNRERLPGL